MMGIFLCLISSRFNDCKLTVLPKLDLAILQKNVFVKVVWIWHYSLFRTSLLFAKYMCSFFFFFNEINKYDGHVMCFMMKYVLLRYVFCCCCRSPSITHLLHDVNSDCSYLYCCNFHAICPDFYSFVFVVPCCMST